MKFQRFFKQKFDQQFEKNHKNTNTKKYFWQELTLIIADNCVNLCLRKK